MPLRCKLSRPGLSTRGFCWTTLARDCCHNCSPICISVQYTHWRSESRPFHGRQVGVYARKQRKRRVSLLDVFFCSPSTPFLADANCERALHERNTAARAARPCFGYWSNRANARRTWASRPCYLI
jgi:hypothetical protein